MVVFGVAVRRGSAATKTDRQQTNNNQEKRRRGVTNSLNQNLCVEVSGALMVAFSR